MLKVSGNVRIVKNVGIASSNLSHGMSLTEVIIKNPTTIRAGAVTGETNRESPPAGFGIGSEPPKTEIKGEKGSASRKRIPTTTLVRPVRPPSATPDPLSM